jgi:hypothetical protein
MKYEKEKKRKGRQKKKGKKRNQGSKVGDVCIPSMANEHDRICIRTG